MIYKDLKERLLYQLTISNQLPWHIQVSDVLFHDARFFLDSNTNSIVSITANSSSAKFEGTLDIYYNRYSVADYFNGLVIPGKAEDYGRLHVLLEYLEETLGLPLYKEEFTNPTLSGPTVTLSPYNSSLYYIPLTSVTLPFAG